MEKKKVNTKKTAKKNIKKTSNNLNIMTGGVYNTGIFVQCILLVILFILAICSIFIPVLLKTLEAMLILMLFTMSYNNYFTFKRRGFTVGYSAAAILALVATIVSSVYGL